MSYYTTIDSPVGPLTLTSDGESLTAVYLPNSDYDPTLSQSVASDDAAPFPEARRQFTEYFEGKRTTFNLPMSPRGTMFQKRVWLELMSIPYGATASYGEIARLVGNPNASRAVGLANGQNPIAIIVPCHRVIGSNGKLVGYGGGLPCKQALLDLEAKHAAPVP